MGAPANRHLIAYLPLVVAVTLLVAVLPAALVWWLRATEVVTSFWVGAAISIAVAFVVWYAGAALWKTRTGARDILFSELLLWGWVQRWRNDRRLNAAADVLGLLSGTPRAVPEGGLSNEQKAELLAQLSTTLEARDPYTHGHSRRVARHATNIARRMGISGEQVAKIRAAAVMHDVGKLETPTAILHKEGGLTDEEFAVIKRHPGDGALMVATLEDDELTALVRHHHERIDGTGYPDGLAGDQIPLGARIIAVADTFDAITSTRAYRRAHPHKRALDILTAEAGSQLDADAVRAFCACYSGRRPLAVWTMVSNGAPRFASWFGSGLGNASAGTVASVVATAAAALGGAALGPVVDETPAAGDRGGPTAAAATASPDRERREAQPERRTARLPRGDGANRPKRGGRARGTTPRPGRATPDSPPPAPAPAPAYSPPAEPVSLPAPAPVAAPPRPEVPQGAGGDDDGGDGGGRDDGRGGGRDRGKDKGRDRGRGNGGGQGKDHGGGQGKDHGEGRGHGRGDDRGRPGGGPDEEGSQGPVRDDGRGPGAGNPNGPSTGGGPGNGRDPGNGRGPGNGNGPVPPIDPATGLPLEEVDVDEP